jgi:hypothetical protein
MECALSTGVMETGRVASVRPWAVVLLAAASMWSGGAAAPASGTVDEGAPLVAWRAALVAAAPFAALVVGALVAAPAVLPALGVPRASGPAVGAVDRDPALDGTGDVDGSPAPRATEGVPARTDLAPGSGAVSSLSSKNISKSEDAMGEVDMSAKGKKDSSKTTCLEVMTRLDPSSRHR